VPLDRRTLLATVPGMAVWPTLAKEAPAVLEAYGRDTGGRIGFCAENLSTGAKIAWRAEERLVVCSTFKASLAAFVPARADREVGRDPVASHALAPTIQRRLPEPDLPPCRLRSRRSFLPHSVWYRQSCGSPSRGRTRLVP
jgi:hypothetical protein